MRLELSSRGILLLAAIAAGLWLLAALWPVVLMVISGLVFAIAAVPLIEWLQRHGFNRAMAVVSLLILVLLAVLLVGWLVAPALYSQGRQLVDRLPAFRETLVRLLASHGAGDLADEVQRANPLSLFQSRVAATVAISLLGGLMTAGTVIGLTAYILIDADRLENFVYLCTPATYHVHVRYLLSALRDVVGGYIGGQILTSLAVTVYAFAVLSLLRIPEPLALAVFAGIADVIPVVGTTLAVLPPTLVALTISLPRAIVVAAALLLYVQFENSVLVPRVYGKNLRLPGVVTILAVVIGSQLLGIVGAFFALPAAAALRATIIYAHDVHVRRARQPAAPGSGGTATSDDVPAVAAHQEV